MSDSDANSAPKYPPLTGTREEQLAQMKKHLEEVKKQHPELDVEKASEQIMKPSIDLKMNLKEQLDPATNERLNEAIKKIFLGDADTIKEIKAEVEQILVGHEDILKQINDSIFANADSLAKMQEYFKQQEAEGKHPFPALASNKS